MAYDPIQLTIYTGLTALVETERQFADQFHKKPNSFKEYPKVFRGTLLQNAIEDVCRDQSYSQTYYPVFYAFARGVQDVFYTSELTGEEILEEAMTPYQGLLKTEMTSRQIGLIDQFRDFIEGCKNQPRLHNAMPVIYKTQDQIKATKTVFSDSFGEMTTDEMLDLRIAVSKACRMKQDGLCVPLIKTPPANLIH